MIGSFRNKDRFCQVLSFRIYIPASTSGLNVVLVHRGLFNTSYEVTDPILRGVEKKHHSS